MRALIFVVLLGACAGREQSCDMSVTRDLSFTSAEARETVTTRAFGPSCDKATGLYDVRAEDGHPIWAWSAPLSRAFGDAFTAEDTEHMQDFLQRWAQPRISTTQQAPEWAALGAGQTTLDQFTYDDVRVRDLPMLCHASGTGRETCVFWEPAAGGAGHLFDRNLEETEP